jgi:hypothetical protein
MRHQFTIVWAGIINNLLTGPYELLPGLSGASYLHFLMEELLQLLKEVLLATLQTTNMWFMHDGVPAHFTSKVKQFLDSHHPDQ